MTSISAIYDVVVDWFVTLHDHEWEACFYFLFVYQWGCLVGIQSIYAPSPDAIFAEFHSNPTTDVVIYCSILFSVPKSCMTFPVNPQTDVLSSSDVLNLTKNTRLPLSIDFTLSRIWQNILSGTTEWKMAICRFTWLFLIWSERIFAKQVKWHPKLPKVIPRYAICGDIGFFFEFRQKGVGSGFWVNL